MTELPDSVRESVVARLRRDGLGRRIEQVVPVGGGCINHGSTLTLDGGVRLFLKWSPAAVAGVFAAEAAGLEALRAAASAVGADVRVPRPLAHAEDNGPPWLLLEHVEAGRRASGADARLGTALALLHSAPCETAFGWERDNWIGSLPQSNQPGPDWATFWRDRRILPQLELARSRGLARAKVFDRLVDTLSAAQHRVPPALVHGDLWSGNRFAAADGRPVLIDPAVYRGDGEVDLAMTELFGGFSADFYDAYAEVRPVSPEYRSHRRPLYQLYYLLVHVNLFGASYEDGARTAAERALAAAG